MSAVLLCALVSATGTAAAEAAARGDSMNSESPRKVETDSFSQGWWFRLGEYDVSRTGQSAGAWESDGGWDAVNLPHTYNAANTFVPIRGYYRGIGWYRKHFTLSEADAARKVFLEFGAAFSVADLWVNEHHVGRYMGGYTGFEADVTAHVRPGDNLVAVKVTNAHDPDVLPGKDIPDYDLYGGLYREASLVIKDPVYLPRNAIRVMTPVVSDARAVVQFEVKVRNGRADARAVTCEVEVRDPRGNPVLALSEAKRLRPGSEDTFVLRSGELANPALWSVDAPNLYAARVRVMDDGALSDEDRTDFGFRWYEFTVNDGFLLNGKPLRIHGVNRHQDYAGLGNALAPRLQVRDAELIKELGGNFVRCSHYPQHPAFLDACDRLGILVYEEIASWQYIGGEQFARNAEEMLREMIDRDKNHPSIILWGLLNEGRSRPLFERLNRAAHESDPTRLTVYAENNPEEGAKLGTVNVPDVLGLNYMTDQLEKVRSILPDRRMLVSEHTNGDMGTATDVGAALQQIDKIKESLDQIDAHPWLAGGCLWCMHDYGTDYWPVWPEQHSGVLTSARLPKESFYYLQSRWTTKPFVHICGPWTWPGEEGKSRTVAVVSNCDRVELFLNGKSLGERAGANPARWEVPYEPGELKAVGTAAGTACEDLVRTAGAPAALQVTAEPARMRADAADMTEITVRLVDASGQTVPQTGTAVSFGVDGPGVLCGIGGRTQCGLRNGVGRIVLRSWAEPGSVRVTAHAPGVPAAETAVMAEPVSTP